jgi:hypothetical protein
LCSVYSSPSGDFLTVLDGCRFSGAPHFLGGQQYLVNVTYQVSDSQGTAFQQVLVNVLKDDDEIVDLSPPPPDGSSNN